MKTQIQGGRQKNPPKHDMAPKKKNQAFSYVFSLRTLKRRSTDRRLSSQVAPKKKTEMPQARLPCPGIQLWYTVHTSCLVVKNVTF